MLERTCAFRWCYVYERAGDSSAGCDDNIRAGSKIISFFQHCLQVAAK